MIKINQVAFSSEKLRDNYKKLEKGKFEEKELFEFINRAMEDLKKNPFCGIRLSNKLIPKVYIEKFGIDNLWKYNLPNSWRLVYSIIGNQVKIVSLILEWFNHKDYERRFNY